MSRDPELVNGLYECDGCGRTYDSEVSLVFCCNGDEEQRRGIYRGLE